MHTMWKNRAQRYTDTHRPPAGMACEGVQLCLRAENMLSQFRANLARASQMSTAAAEAWSDTIRAYQCEGEQSMRLASVTACEAY